MTKRNSFKTIIIGAGIAGLAASNRLRELGCETEILEARDRSVGRISTDTSLELPIARGASWIHGDRGNPMSLLADQYHVQKRPVNPDNFETLDRNNHKFALSTLETFAEKFVSMLEKAKKIACRTRKDLPLLTVLLHLTKQYNFSPSESELFKIKCASYDSYAGAGYGSLSARHWDHEEIWPGDNVYLTDTYQPIVDGLAETCQIHLNQIVKEIVLLNNKVEVVTQNSIYVADAAIITVPLGVLKQECIKFTPPLPKEKIHAIACLGMGVFNITAIKFPYAFWGNETHATFINPGSSSGIPVFFNLHHFVNKPILIGYSGGERAKEIERLPDDMIIQKVMKQCYEIYDCPIPQPDSYFQTRWSEDPFSFGSYSYISHETPLNAYAALAQPIANKLYFAGEATSEKYAATTHGAYLDVTPIL
jgi:polyamine oxidase